MATLTQILLIVTSICLVESRYRGRFPPPFWSPGDRRALLDEDHAKINIRDDDSVIFPNEDVEEIFTNKKLADISHRVTSTTTEKHLIEDYQLNRKTKGDISKPGRVLPEVKDTTQDDPVFDDKKEANDSKNTTNLKINDVIEVKDVPISKENDTKTNLLSDVQELEVKSYDNNTGTYESVPDFSSRFGETGNYKLVPMNTQNYQPVQNFNGVPLSNAQGYPNQNYGLNGNIVNPQFVTNVAPNTGSHLQYPTPNGNYVGNVGSNVGPGIGSNLQYSVPNGNIPQNNNFFQASPNMNVGQNVQYATPNVNLRNNNFNDAMGNGNVVPNPGSNVQYPLQNPNVLSNIGPNTPFFALSNVPNGQGSTVNTLVPVSVQNTYMINGQFYAAVAVPSNVNVPNVLYYFNPQVSGK